MVYQSAVPCSSKLYIFLKNYIQHKKIKVKQKNFKGKYNNNIFKKWIHSINTLLEKVIFKIILNLRYNRQLKKNITSPAMGTWVPTFLKENS